MGQTTHCATASNKPDAQTAFMLAWRQEAVKDKAGSVNRSKQYGARREFTRPDDRIAPEECGSVRSQSRAIA